MVDGPSKKPLHDMSHVMVCVDCIDTFNANGGMGSTLCMQTRAIPSQYLVLPSRWVFLRNVRDCFLKTLIKFYHTPWSYDDTVLGLATFCAHLNCREL